MDGKLALWLVIITSILVWIVAVPIVIYTTINFWRSRDAQYIKKRRPILVIFFIVVMLFDAAIIRPLSGLFEILFIIPSYDDNDNDNNTRTHLWLQSDHISVALFWFISLVPLIGNVRLFTLMYDWNKSKELLSLRWKSQITSTQYHETSFINIFYHKIFGNFKILLFIVVIWFIITDIIMISTASNTSIQLVFGILFITLDVGPCVMLLIFSLFLKDSIGIRKEIIKLITLCLIVLIAWSIVNLFIQYEIYTYQRSVSKVFIFIPSIIIAAMIMAKPDPDNIFCKNNHRLRFVSSAMSNIRSYSHTTDNLNPLYAVLNDEHGLDYFADYLVKEFSIENLLYLIEFKHLQIELLRNNILCDNQMEQYSIWNLEISNQTMQLFNKAQFNNCKECSNYMVIIFTHYISSSAMSQINISSKTRIQIQNLIQSNNYNAINDKILVELYIKYQDAAKQIFHLLSTDSFSRFIKTSEYVNWKHLTCTVQVTNLVL